MAVQLPGYQQVDHFGVESTGGGRPDRSPRFRLALSEAFWTWTVMVSLLVNITTSILFLALILQDRPLAAVVAGYAISVPYNVVATVGVWRSAARYAGPSLHADLARIACVILMAVLTLT